MMACLRSWNAPVFYIPYIIFELPANMAFHHLEPRKFMGTIIMGWGCEFSPRHTTSSAVGWVGVGADYEWRVRVVPF